MKLKSLLLVAMLLAVSPLQSQTINLRIYDWYPPNFPIHNVLLSWDGPCGDYSVLTNSDLSTTNWGVYSVVQKLYYLNVPLASVFTVTTNTPQMFFAISFVEAPFQEQCQESQVQIFVQPQDTTVNTNQTARLETYAVGPEGMTYQWHKDGSEITGETNRILSIPHVVPADAGVYYVTVESPLGQKRLSDNATLTVVEAPSSPPSGGGGGNPPGPTSSSLSMESTEQTFRMMLNDPHPEINPIYHKLLKELEKGLK